VVNSQRCRLPAWRSFCTCGKARAACQNFLTLWNDAHPDISILKQAEAEYARLHQGR
jgi:hypothetical protein